MKTLNSSKHHMLIVGAGPKALALGLRAHVLKEFNFTVPEITIVEKSEIAAHWTGRHGFTNGQLKLGTSPEKDLGFPYENDGSTLSIKISERLQNFSWRSYLIRKNLYSAWVDRGNPQPSHQEWGAYLKFVAEEISGSVNFVTGEVVRAIPRDKKWSFIVKQGRNAEMTMMKSDSLVVTGPAVTKMPSCFPSEKIFNMENVWERLTQVPKDQNLKIAVVGNGETAASVLIAIGKKQFPLLEIDVITPQGAIFTRGESFVENRFYSASHRTHWKSMSVADRRNFVRRTDIGVFSPNALNELKDESFRIVPGRVVGVESDLKNSSGKVSVKVEYAGQSAHHPYDYVIFASGLNHMKLLEKLLGEVEVARLSEKVPLEEKIREDLSLEGSDAKIYLPMLAGLEQGPGFANLSCLGLLASRILDPLVELAQANHIQTTEGHNETRYLSDKIRHTA